MPIGAFRKGNWEIKITDELSIDSLLANQTILTKPTPFLIRNMGFNKGVAVQLPT